MSDTPSYTDGQPCKNTDKHLWPIQNDDYYAPSVHATEDGRIGMNVGGLVFVKSIREWHSLASGERIAGPDDTTLQPGQVAVDAEVLRLAQLEIAGLVEDLVVREMPSVYYTIGKILEQNRYGASPAADQQNRIGTCEQCGEQVSKEFSPDGSHERIMYDKGGNAYPELCGPVHFDQPAADKPRIAGDCTKCGGPVHHRQGSPGEFDHDCADQPKPSCPEFPDNSKCAPIVEHGPVGILPLVIHDMKQRGEMGMKKYGRPLTASNGRDALRDAYEEAMDLCQYLRQAIEERGSDPAREGDPMPDTEPRSLSYDTEAYLSEYLELLHEEYDKDDPERSEVETAHLLHRIQQVEDCIATHEKIAGLPGSDPAREGDGDV